MARIFLLALASLVLGVSPSVMADEGLSQATTADVRCVVVASVMGNQEANAHSAALVALYFLGRIDAREPPSFDLSKAMLSQISLMTPTDFNSEGKRCGKELESRAMYLADAGQKLKQLSTEQKQ